MNTILIPYIAGVLSAASVPAAFEEAGVPWHDCAHHCWAAQYPYRPQMQFALAWTGEGGGALLVAYRVSERCLRAESVADGQRPWTDSCCELFFAPDSGGYYNLECNCAGHLILAYGAGREARTMAPAAAMASVGRWASLGPGRRARAEGDFRWQLALRVPFAALFRHPGIAPRRGEAWRGNVYKCGDETIPHFLSCFPVDTPAPDFHRPDFFGTFRFG